MASKFLDIVFKMRAQDFLAGEEEIITAATQVCTQTNLP